MSSGVERLEADLRSGRFLAGAAKGRWRSQGIEWPYALIQVSARGGRLYTLRFECSGYPESPPTATLWDVSANQQLPSHLWPSGGRVSQVFNPGWKGGAALYLPCDRESIPGHSNWLTEHPWLIWNPTRGLLQYVEAVCEILQSKELICEAA